MCSCGSLANKTCYKPTSHLFIGVPSRQRDCQQLTTDSYMILPQFTGQEVTRGVKNKYTMTNGCEYRKSTYLCEDFIVWL